MRSSISAGARFLDRDEVLRSLRRISEQLLQDDLEVQGVALFGSLARGDYSLRSDADILVCLRSSPEEKVADRIPPLLAAFLEAPVPVDVLPLTASEICQRLQDPSPFWSRISREAILLAGTLPWCPESTRCSRLGT
ncbi:MAG: nucleotidyltransferase domain-containing protein [Acidobacteria bacterium]|nr:nucleotidyltransferase domain-containing protein [Acidobacteriota bacterium]